MSEVNEKLKQLVNEQVGLLAPIAEAMARGDTISGSTTRAFSRFVGEGQFGNAVCVGGF